MALRQGRADSGAVARRGLIKHLLRSRNFEKINKRHNGLVRIL